VDILLKSCGKAVEKLCISCGKPVENLWKTCGKAVEEMWKTDKRGVVGVSTLLILRLNPTYNRETPW
jgi:predicted nucleic acid-binding Zn ribbon protein